MRGACNQLVEHLMYKAIIISMCIVAGKRHYIKLVLKLMAHTHYIISPRLQIPNMSSCNRPSMKLISSHEVLLIGTPGTAYVVGS